MIQIQQAVADWLGQKTGVRAVAGRSPVQSYPLFTVEAELSGVTALDGGRQCEERFSVTVTAAPNSAQIVRNARSVTPAIGASTRSPVISKFPSFMLTVPRYRPDRSSPVPKRP